MPSVVATRNLFVNTEETLVGDCRDTTINLPQNLFSCNENQVIRLTLGSFSMKQNWYSVNSGNNKFYFVSHDGASPPAISSALVTIKEGDYQSFSDEDFGLCRAIKNALQEALSQSPYNISSSAAHEVTHDPVTNLITIEIVQTGSDVTISDFKFVSFTLANYTPKPSGTGITYAIIGSNFSSAFQDNWQIMGGCKQDKIIDDSFGGTLAQFTALTDMYNKIAGPKHNGYWRASLATQENLYIRTDLNGTNFQTSGFDANSSLFPYVVSSQILAKIPLSNENTDYVKEYDVPVAPATSAIVGRYVYEKPYKLIEFMDNGENLFSVMLPQKHLSQLRLHLTDAYGRPIPIGAEQLQCSGSPFTATIRCDVME